MFLWAFPPVPNLQATSQQTELRPLPALAGCCFGEVNRPGVHKPVLCVKSDAYVTDTGTQVTELGSHFAKDKGSLGLHATGRLSPHTARYRIRALVFQCPFKVWTAPLWLQDMHSEWKGDFSGV